MFKNLKNIEWSKRLTLFIIMMILLTFCLVIASVIMGQSDPLVALITGVFSLASISFGFYFWKAKNENLKKFAKSITKEDAKKIAVMYEYIFGGNEDDRA